MGLEAALEAMRPGLGLFFDPGGRPRPRGAMVVVVEVLAAVLFGLATGARGRADGADEEATVGVAAVAEEEEEEEAVVAAGVATAEEEEAGEAAKDEAEEERAVAEEVAEEVVVEVDVEEAAEVDAGSGSYGWAWVK